MLGKTTDDASSVLYDMWQRLGIGEKTGIEIGNESAGLVTDPSLTPWQPIDLANHAFGQGVAVTPLQLVRAFAAMANGGDLVQPHIYTEDDSVAAATVHQVISAQLSDTLRQLMVHVVDAGPNYAEETQIPGYVVGGKTGTAQIWDQQTSAWLPDTYNHTFVGYIGNPMPEAIILVRIHDTIPRVPVRWGMTLADDLERAVASRRPGGDPDARLAATSGLRRRPGHRSKLAARPAPRSKRPGRPTRRLIITTRLYGLSISRRCCRHSIADQMRKWRDVADRAHSAEIQSFDSESLAAAVGGALLRPGSRPISGGAVDSRRVEPGNAFFALAGERTDGHRFVADAARRGAAALVCLETTLISAASTTSPSSMLMMSLLALRQAAAAWRDRFSPLVVGVTGSLAKTSTKEQTAEVLECALAGAAQHGQ